MADVYLYADETGNLDFAGATKQGGSAYFGFGTAMFGELQKQQPRIDATLLLKANAYDYIRRAGEMRLYKMAWYLHFKHVATEVSAEGDTLDVVVSTLSTKARRAQARAALQDVCAQINRKSVLCVWDAGTSWGLQIADYALWAIQRRSDGGSGTWWDNYVRTSTASAFFPWGAATPMTWS